MKWSSRADSAILASNGLRIAPCGSPVGVCSRSPSVVMTPAFRDALASATTCLSLIRCRSRSRIGVCPSSSNRARASNIGTSALVDRNLSEPAFEPLVTVERLGASGGHVIVGFALAGLPFGVPEPCLAGIAATDKHRGHQPCALQVWASRAPGKGLNILPVLARTLGMSLLQKIGALVGAGIVASGIGVVTARGPAGAAESRELIVCNWTSGFMVLETDGAWYGNVATGAAGCVQSFQLPVGYGFTIRLDNWSGQVLETRWSQPGQNMRIDITGPVGSAQYSTTYW